MAVDIREIGKRGKNTDLAMNNGRMEVHIQVIISMGVKPARVNFFGKMAENMQETLQMEILMVMESSRGKMEKNMQEHGRTIK